MCAFRARAVLNILLPNPLSQTVSLPWLNRVDPRRTGEPTKGPLSTSTATGILEMKGGQVEKNLNKKPRHADVMWMSCGCHADVMHEDDDRI